MYGNKERNAKIFALQRVSGEQAVICCCELLFFLLLSLTFLLASPTIAQRNDFKWQFDMR